MLTSLIRKYFLFILFFTQIPYAAVAQKKSDLLKDTIVWNAARLLVREDFKAKPHGSYYGLTASAIMLSTKEENGKMEFVVVAVFIPSRSSLKTDSQYGLKHEQG